MWTEPMGWYVAGPPLSLVSNTCVETDGMDNEVCETEMTVGVPLPAAGRSDARGATPRQLELDLRLGQDEIEPIFSGAAWAGTVLWRAAVQLCERLLLTRYRAELACGATCIELGCGIGVPGMVAAMLGADVTLTEQQNLVALIQRNIESNFDAAEQRRLRASVLSWDAASARALAAATLPPGRSHFDFILCCTASSSRCTMRAGARSRRRSTSSAALAPSRWSRSRRAQRRAAGMASASSSTT